MATINNGQETLHDSVLYTSATENGDHVFESTFQIPAHANCLKITVSLSVRHSSSYVFVYCFIFLYNKLFLIINFNLLAPSS